MWGFRPDSDPVFGENRSERCGSRPINMAFNVWKNLLDWLLGFVIGGTSDNSQMSALRNEVAE